MSEIYSKHEKAEIYSARILKELDRAMDKHAPMVSVREGHSVIEEEYDEFWDAIKKDDIDHAREEVIQLAAMCIRFLVDLEHSHEKREQQG